MNKPQIVSVVCHESLKFFFFFFFSILQINAHIHVVIEFYHFDVFFFFFFRFLSFFLCFVRLYSRIFRRKFKSVTLKMHRFYCKNCCRIKAWNSKTHTTWNKQLIVDRCTGHMDRIEWFIFFLNFILTKNSQKICIDDKHYNEKLVFILHTTFDNV